MLKINHCYNCKVQTNLHRSVLPSRQCYQRKDGRGKEKQHIGFKLEATGFSLLHKASQTASGCIQLQSSVLLCKLLDFNEQARKGLTREPQHPPQQTNANWIYYYYQQQYQHSNNNLPCVHINFLSEPRTHPQKKCRGNEISLTPNNISVKCSIWSDPEKKFRAKKISLIPYISVRSSKYSAKKCRANKIWVMPNVSVKSSIESAEEISSKQKPHWWGHIFLWIPRTNPQKKCEQTRSD